MSGYGQSVWGVYVDVEGHGQLTLVTVHTRRGGEGDSDPNTAEAAAKLYGGKVMEVKVLK